MNEKMKHQWIDALRSGKFNQCGHYLKVFLDEKDPTKCSHCAVGVACELFIPEKFTAVEGSSFNFFRIEHSYAHLKSVTGISVDMFKKVIHCNDTGGSYEDCAKVIESFEAV